MGSCDNCEQPFERERAVDDADEERLVCDPCKLLKGRDRRIHVSALRSEDLELILAWRSNPEVYQYFRRQSGPLDWDEHVAWYDSRDSKRYDFVVHFDGRRVGSVNITAEDEVGIYVGDFSARGRGVATNVLRWACDRFEDRAPLKAEVHVDNDASKRLFEGCGFQKSSTDGEWLQYVYTP